MESLPKEQNHISYTKETDPLLKEYLEMKKSFKKVENILGVKVSKEQTSILVKILKPVKVPFKNVNPIKHSNNSNDNIYLTKYYPNQKEELEKFIHSSLSPEQLNTVKYSLCEEIVTLGVANYSYDELIKIVSKNELTSVPGGFEIIGKIAHLNLREGYLKYKYVIGQLILDKNPSIRTVVNKVSKIDNVYRTYEMEVLAGKEDFNVEHKEGNIMFHFNLKNTYWCSRLQGERDRVLSLLKKGEVLCDAFCGVGPLSLRACKKGLRVLANDLNPSCYEYINNNIKINKLNSSMITTFNMDAREFMKICIEKSKKVIDDEEDNLDKKFPHDLHIHHIYMNLPKDAIEFLDVFVGLFKGCKETVYSKGNLPIVHVYGFAKTDSGSDPKRELKERIAKAFKMEYEEFEEECKDDILHIENVRDISTKKMVFCIDMRIPYCVAYGLKVKNK